MGQPGFVVGPAGVAEREEAIERLAQGDAGGNELFLAFLFPRLGQHALTEVTSDRTCTATTTIGLAGRYTDPS